MCRCGHLKFRIFYFSNLRDYAREQSLYLRILEQCNCIVIYTIHFINAFLYISTNLNNFRSTINVYTFFNYWKKGLIFLIPPDDRPSATNGMLTTVSKALVEINTHLYGYNKYVPCTFTLTFKVLLTCLCPLAECKTKYVFSYTICGPEQLSRYSDWLWAGRSGGRVPVETRFSAPV